MFTCIYLCRPASRNTHSWLAKKCHVLYFLKPEYGAKERCRSLVFFQTTWVTICWKVWWIFPNDTKNKLSTSALNQASFSPKNTWKKLSQLHQQQNTHWLYESKGEFDYRIISIFQIFHRYCDRIDSRHFLDHDKGTARIWYCERPFSKLYIFTFLTVCLHVLKLCSVTSVNGEITVTWQKTHICEHIHTPPSPHN